MAKLTWTDPALEDLRAIIDHVARDSPAYATTLGTGLVEAPRRLEEFPRSGRVVPEFQESDIRELIHGPYRIIYLLRTDACYITTVIHGSRDLITHVDPAEWETE